MWSGTELDQPIPVMPQRLTFSYPPTLLHLLNWEMFCGQSVLQFAVEPSRYRNVLNKPEYYLRPLELGRTRPTLAYETSILRSHLQPRSTSHFPVERQHEQSRSLRLRNLVTPLFEPSVLLREQPCQLVAYKVQVMVHQELSSR